MQYRDKTRKFETSLLADKMTGQDKKGMTEEETTKTEATDRGQEEGTTETETGTRTWNKKK